MSFLFASSHLPELEHPADEEEEDVQPMPRSGGVRAFSHLPQPVRRQADSGGAGSPRRGIVPIPPRSDSATLPAPSKPGDQDDPPPPESEDGQGSGADTGPHEPEVSRPWYLPRITHADLQPESGELDDPAPGSAGRAPKKWEPEHDPDPGFDGTPPKAWGKPTRDPGFDATPPQEWGPRTRDPGFDVSPQDVHNGPPAPDTTDGTPAQRRAPFPQSRLFEKRPTPGFSAPTGRPGFNDLVYRQPPQDTSAAAPARPRGLTDIPGTTFQQVAAKTGAQQQPYAQLSQSSPPTRPANARPTPPQTPAQGRGPTPPAPGGAAAPQNAGAGAAPQGGGSLAHYRQQRQALLDSKNSASKETQTKIASITRNMESIELAAHLINHTKQGKEAAIDPESIDENSDEFKNRARNAISRLHGGSAPWMDHLAENFGEREGPKGGPANPRLVKALGIDPTAAAWCGSALGKAMGKAGIKPPDAASWAGNWRKWGIHNGPRAGGPHVGDVYHIKYPDDSGHVTSVVGVSKDGTQVFCLGGNQNDGVNIAAYPIGQFNDPKKPDIGNYKGTTIVYKKPLGQKNTTPAPTFNYNADPSSFNTLAHLTR